MSSTETAVASRRLQYGIRESGDPSRPFEVYGRMLQLSVRCATEMDARTILIALLWRYEEIVMKIDDDIRIEKI